MKFDFVIGNPPYQEDKEGTSDKPIYNIFMDSIFPLADKVEMISPARFLFNTGKTPKAWNEKMLSDPHLKVLFYEADSSKIFRNTSIPGGIAITYRDSETYFGAIDVFSPYVELRSIRKKMQTYVKEENITKVMYGQNRFNLDVLYSEHPECSQLISSDGREKRIVSSALEKLDVFSEEKIDDESVQIFGVVNGKRKVEWIKQKYIEDNGNLYKWKTIVSQSNGASGTINSSAARIIAPPLICEPTIGYSQTFIGIGSFDTEDEAKACMKYVMSKFARAMLGILKATQHNPPDRWVFVPLQDFTSSSDIDWSKSIPEIDQQLYAKYGLNEDEIAFIESHVKEME